MILHIEAHDIKNQNSCTKTFPSTQLTAKAQEKISLEPKIVFSHNDEEVQKLRTILAQKDHIQSHKTELFNALRNTQTPIAGTQCIAVSNNTPNKQSIIENIIELEFQNINLDEQLNIHLTPEDEQLLSNLDNEIKQITNQITNQTSNTNIDESISHTTSIINQLIPLYRKAEAIQTFTENELMKSESGKLFIIIKENCQSHIDVLAQAINSLTEATDNLIEVSPQEQTSGK